MNRRLLETPAVHPSTAQVLAALGLEPPREGRQTRYYWTAGVADLLGWSMERVGRGLAWLTGPGMEPMGVLAEHAHSVMADLRETRVWLDVTTGAVEATGPFKFEAKDALRALCVQYDVRALLADDPNRAVCA